MDIIIKYNSYTLPPEFRSQLKSVPKLLPVQEPAIPGSTNDGSAVRRANTTRNRNET